MSVEDYSAQPIVDVSPPKWHLGHTTWFFENFILKPLRNYRVFDDSFFFLFNSYYVSQGDRLERNKRGNLIRPFLSEILDYRKAVDIAMIRLLEDHAISQEQRKFIELGLNHEQQHQELLVTDIKYIFSTNPLLPAIDQGVFPNSTPSKQAYINIDEGIYEIGHDDLDFSFDNERGRHKVFINGFKVSSQVVNCREFLEFIEDEGYKRPELWLSEGWDWVTKNKINGPEYWFKEEGMMKHFTWRGVKAIDPNAPVTHVSFYEAEAFARWSCKRLLTEFEWEVAAQQLSSQESGVFLEDNQFHPLQLHKEVSMFGNTWEWTNSAYLPYPNYRQEKGALGEYNGKFMINQMVLRGGSCATPKDHFRLTYRNFFHPHLRWQFTGIRLGE